MTTRRHHGGEMSIAEDLLAVEEPLEIRIGERPISVTMRTPGHDDALVAGFLVSESIVAERQAIASIRHWGSANTVRVTLREGATVDFQRLQRHFYSTSSCGICGKTSIDALRVHARPLQSALRLDAGTLSAMPAALRRAQPTFDATGGLHAAALFSADGRLLSLHEDIGRHNAVDKVIGEQFLEGRLPLSEHVLFVSGRTSFEIVQKAVMAGIPIVAAISAPSSLAVRLAREFNVTLAGFVREERFNVYAGEERIRAPLIASARARSGRDPAG
ncbi:MAG TPA: formate dehydrogenase accessory sulfurtransferase FdhD [Thermoanaerobaculia bacterium]|nr:formate dehydrogenase accessory sulfurtransferase FdhD [Thermoanaerobaculia bacterium]